MIALACGRTICQNCGTFKDCPCERITGRRAALTWVDTCESCPAQDRRPSPALDPFNAAAAEVAGFPIVTVSDDFDPGSVTFVPLAAGSMPPVKCRPMMHVFPGTLREDGTVMHLDAPLPDTPCLCGMVTFQAVVDNKTEGQIYANLSLPEPPQPAREPAPEAEDGYHALSFTPDEYRLRAEEIEASGALTHGAIVSMDVRFRDLHLTVGMLRAASAVVVDNARTRLLLREWTKAEDDYTRLLAANADLKVLDAALRVVRDLRGKLRALGAE